jgi:hypothetical protein
LTKHGRVLVALSLAVVSVAACRPSRPQLSDEDAGTLIATRVTQLRSAASAGAPVAEEPSAASSPAPSATPRPPRNDAERRSRAQAALPAGRSLGALTPVGDGSRFALALSQIPVPGGKPQNVLQLFDVSSSSGLLVGEHDFGTGETGEGAAAPAAVDAGLELRAEDREPVVLAVFAGGGQDQPHSVPCGWWLRRRGTTFVCAPMLSPQSRFSAADGELVESWDADLPGGRAPQGGSLSTGRILRLTDGRWREVDYFRCLAAKPADAMRQAGSNGIGLWQREMVQRWTAAARHAKDGLDTDTARAQLHEALRVDACDAEAYRLLGRLEFDTGRAGEAVPALATAVALAPRDDGALLDLGDALAVLNSRTPAGHASWTAAVATLDDRPPTRAIVDRARGRAHGAIGPRDLAIAFYGTFLDRTASAADLQEGARRHAEEKLAELERPAARHRH